MLIASKHKRPKAPITLGGKDGTPPVTYFFTPIDPADPASEHVAEVTISEHIQRLLGIPEGYHIAAAQSLATVARPETTPPPQNPPPPPPAAPPATDPNATTPPTGEGEQGTATPPPPQGPTADQVEAAGALLSMSWQKLKVTVEGTDPAVLRLALEIEQAKGELAQETKIKILTAALKD